MHLDRMDTLYPLQLSEKGPEISEMVYGTWRILDDAKVPAPHEIADRFEAAIEMGITTIDTAEIYGGYSVEKAVGDAIRLRPHPP